MKMNKRYGIFDHEVDGLIKLVHQHASLDVIENTPCPSCDAAIRVFFWPDGNAFCLRCIGKPTHMSRCQEISSAPSWWRERVGEVTEWI
jgi:hypothetical protein